MDWSCCQNGVPALEVPDGSLAGIGLLVIATMVLPSAIPKAGEVRLLVAIPWVELDHGLDGLVLQIEVEDSWWDLEIRVDHGSDSAEGSESTELAEVAHVG